ncbi:MAG: biotin transporter BioY [Treponemataceae bacterium]
MIHASKFRFTKQSFFIVIFACLISLSNFLTFSYEGIQFSVQQICILLTGLLLGFPQSGAAVGVFFLMGIAGLPVFPNFNSGVYSLFYGTHAGYLMGYFFAAITASYMLHKNEAKKIPFVKILTTTIAATIILYVFGINHIQKDPSKTILDAINQELSVVRLISEGIQTFFVAIVAYFLHPLFLHHIHAEKKQVQ